MDYKKILFGYDGSPEADIAFDKAVEICLRNKATLVIAEAVKPQAVNTESVALGYGVAFRDIDNEEYLSERQERLDDLKQVAEQKGVTNVETDLVVNNPKMAIAHQMVKKHQPDLIVLGATGMGRVARVLIGSTATYVVENAPVDVIIVK